MPLQPGTILENRYRVDSLLGQGGIGAVYRAWDSRLEAWVPIKENLVGTAGARGSLCTQPGEVHRWPPVLPPSWPWLTVMLRAGSSS